ncbi:hypothetical protein RB195_023181 [Necator americanus]
MVRRQVDMAVEEIRIEVVDDFLHPPSRCNGCSLWVPESSHPRLATGEVSTGIADAFPRLCSFSQHFCSSLFKVFLYRLSAKPCELGREFLVPCGSCCSTLAYQLKSFKRQAPPGGFKTLSLLRAVVKVFDKPVIFLVDVVHCRIFPKAGQRSEEIPVDGSPGISLSEFGGFLCSPCEGKFSSEAMVRSRIELWYNSDIRQAEPFIDDDVVYFITVPSTE